MKQPLCDWMAAANGFAIYSAHMIPWPRSGMVSLPIKRRLPRKRRTVGHNPGIITALRLLYHSNKPIRACLPQSGSETGKAGFGCGVTCAVRCFAAAAAIRRLQTALPFALRILYHVREAAWYNRPSWRERAAPAYRPGHKIGIITALRLLYHSNKPIRACLPQSGSETGKAGFGCGVTCAVRCFAAAAAIRGLQTALPFALRILYHITHCVSTNFSPTQFPIPPPFFLHCQEPPQSGRLVPIMRTEA